MIPVIPRRLLMAFSMNFQIYYICSQVPLPMVGFIKRLPQGYFLPCGYDDALAHTFIPIGVVEGVKLRPIPTELCPFSR